MKLKITFKETTKRTRMLIKPKIIKKYISKTIDQEKLSKLFLIKETLTHYKITCKKTEDLHIKGQKITQGKLPVLANSISQDPV